MMGSQLTDETDEILHDMWHFLVEQNEGKVADVHDVVDLYQIIGHCFPDVPMTVGDIRRKQVRLRGCVEGYVQTIKPGRCWQLAGKVQ